MITFTSNSEFESKSRSVAMRYWKKALYHPVNEFLTRQGKRLRADLVKLAFSVSQGRGEAPVQLQEFIELMHAGSLIVDDIQDDATLRRNRPTLHRLIGTPLAINTGNWMYFAAFEKLIDIPVSRNCQAAILKRALATVRRCHEGQALDLAVNVKAIDWKDVEPITRTISELKTGGLVSLAAWLGAAVAGARPQLRQSLARFGMRLGMSLQMQNDLAELRACISEGSPSNDLINSRLTWSWAWAANVCTRKEFVRLQQTDEIVPLSLSLFDCVGTLGTEVVKNQLRIAFDNLRRDLGSGDATQESRNILDRLEKYHV